MTQIDLRLVERCLRLDDLRFGTLDRGICPAGRALRCFEVGRRDELLLEELSRSFQLERRIRGLQSGSIGISLEANDRRLRLLHLRLK